MPLEKNQYAKEKRILLMARLVTGVVLLKQ